MVEQQISILEVHFRHLALLLDSYGKHCLKIDHFVRQLQSWDTGFLAEYHLNVKLLQGHIQFVIHMWVGLHPRAGLTIVAISILLIYASDN